MCAGAGEHVELSELTPLGIRETLTTSTWPELAFLHCPRRTARRLHLFCIGTPRSGTHSLAYMFAKSFRAEHEPIERLTIFILTRWMSGQISDRQMIRCLRARSRFLNLEVEATHYLHHAACLLPRAFHDARFVLTVREPFSWLNSEINQNLITRGHSHWDAIEHARYGRYGNRYTDRDAALAEMRGVYPVENYLRYWSDHHRMVLDHVPRQRLLVLHTHEIASCLDAIAAFLRIDKTLLDVDRVHSGVNPHKRLDLYSIVDRRYVADLVETHCRPILEELFGEAGAKSQRADT